MNHKKTVEELLALADIRIDGNRPWDITVLDDRLYKRAITQTDLGVGESYMDGWWTCEAIDQLFDRIIRADLKRQIRFSYALMYKLLVSRLFNRQSSRRAFQAEEHYNAGNDLYREMLGRHMMYTCGYWRNGAQTLDEAQEAKLELICQKIGLKPGMRVLDVGCGWGAFGRYAAKHYGVEVVGYTVSHEQVKFGQEFCKGLPVEFRCEDYRQAKGRYDRVIIVGAIEHFGHKNYRTYMEVVDRVLEDDGISFIQTIGNNTSDTCVDPFVDKYLYPGGLLPSLAQLGEAMEGLFVLEDLHNFGEDYDRTFMAWNANFQAAWPRLSNSYSSRFKRLWEFYLLMVAGLFRSRNLQLWQIVMTKEGARQPACRFGGVEAPTPSIPEPIIPEQVEV